MRKKIDRVIVTNNPSVAKAYKKEDEVMFMEGATPHEVYTAIRELLMNGGRLSRPVLKDKTSFYTTASVFYDGSTEPTSWNMREIEAACRATSGVEILPGKFNDKMHQMIEMWKNAPSHRYMQEEE